MTTTQFKEIIRKMVIEECKKEVSQQLPKLLFEMVGIQDKLEKQTLTSPAKTTTINESLKQNNFKQGVKLPPKQYSKNPMLNQILNETTPGVVQSTSPDEGIPLPLFDKVGQSNESTFVSINESVSTNTDNQIENNEPFDVSKLFNKNFKEIVDKSMKKTGRNAPNIIQNW